MGCIDYVDNGSQIKITMRTTDFNSTKCLRTFRVDWKHYARVKAARDNYSETELREMRMKQVLENTSTKAVMSS